MAKDVILLADGDEEVLVALNDVLRTEGIRSSQERLRSDRTLLRGHTDIALGNVRKKLPGRRECSFDPARSGMLR